MGIRSLSSGIAIAFMAVCSMAVADVRDYVIQPGERDQEIDGFGASDAWSMRFMGELPEAERNRVADLLFSRKDREDGNPEGIGLGIWRFNIGAGSAEQGDSSKINFGTRTECFLLPDGTYDWSKQKGQREFLRLAKERGVETLLGFLNSPPVYFTKNGLATNTGRGGDYNLREDRYDDFAVFMADVVDSLYIYDGVRLDWLSPVNEPDGHWNWQGPKQEGTPAEKTEIARIARSLDKELSRRGLDTKILIPESSDYRCMFSTHETDHRRGFEIQSFFSADSTDTYVGDLPHLPGMMAGHSYWTNTPVDYMKQCRIQLRDSLDRYGVRFWQSEVCIMGNDDEIGGGGGYDRTMKTALYVARLIHHDLVYAGARSWQWWRAVGGDYKDGLLFRYNDRETGRDTVVDSKLLWSLGNYSRFIRKGARRLEVGTRSGGEILEDSATDPYGLMISAYQNPDKSFVAVALNYSDEPKECRIEVGDGKPDGMEWTMYRTSDVADENLKKLGKLGSDSIVTLPARSITTFVSN